MRESPARWWHSHWVGVTLGEVPRWRCSPECLHSLSALVVSFLFRDWLLPSCHPAFSLPGANARPPSSPKFIWAHDIVACPPLISHPSFCFSCSHICWWHWRKRIWAPASSGWVCGRTSLPVLDAPVSSGSLFGPAVEGFVERFTEAQKSSQAMQHFLPKRTSSSAASSRPRPSPTQQTAKPTPTTPERRPPEGREIEGAHARRDTAPSWSDKNPGPRSPWIRCRRSPPYQPGRKRRGPSLTTAGPPCKQPLICLSPPT